MKVIYSILLVFYFSPCVFGQVSGKLVESNGQPIPFAGVALMKIADSSIVKSALTDEKGYFTMSRAEQGKYILKIRSLVYQEWSSQIVEFTATKLAVDFGTITLKAASQALNEVTIRGEKKLIQQEAGGMVVNVQRSLLTKGSSVLQVLERSPGVTVDPRNHTISLNGKSGVMVMLDGKVMRMSNDQVATLLNNMNADNTEKIELLTTPPANYDADGNAGLINIVTKKNKEAGTNGSFTLTGGYGKGEKAGASINVNHHTDNINLYGSYSFTHDKTFGQLLAEGTENVLAVGGQTTVRYLGISKPVSNEHHVNIGFDRMLDQSLSIGGNVNYINSTDDSHHFNHGTYTMKPDSILLFNSLINGTEKGQNMIGSVNLEKAIRTGEKINFSLDYIYFENKNQAGVQSTFTDNHGNQAGTTDSLYAPIQRDLANTIIKVGVAKLDYSKQFNANWKLEAGAKETYTRNSGTSKIENLIGDSWEGSLQTSSSLTTREVISAGYASLTAQLDTFTRVVAGARYEYSVNTADNAATQMQAFDRRLGKLFPTIFISRKLNDHSELQLSYTKRISRPSYNDLASYITYNDPVSVLTGNPALKPTLTSNLKLSYNFRDYSFLILASRDDDPIVQGQVTTGRSRQLVYISPQNVSFQNNITFQANLPFKVFDWWKMSYSFGGGWKQFKIDYTLIPVKKSYYSYTLNYNESFKLPALFSLEISGYYNSLSYYGVSKVEGLGTLNAGIKKELKNNNGSFQLSVTDLLRSLTYNSYIGSLTQDAFDSKIHINYVSESSKFPVIRLSYSRTFGSSGIKSQKKDHTGANDELLRVRN